MTRPTKYDNWEKPVNLGLIVNSSVFDSYPDISADGLSLFFCSFRPSGYGNLDLWATTRQTKDDDWGTPLNLGPNINLPSYEQDLSISANV